MENKDIKIPIADERIIEDKYMPTPPTSKGVWRDERKDHVLFQKKVPLAAQLGGVSASSGCLTTDAEAVRQAAEKQYHRSQEIPPKKILKQK